MAETPNEFDAFLQGFEPGERLLHATLDQNINDPFCLKRLLDDSSACAPLERTKFSCGKKIMAADEQDVRFYEFLKKKQAIWAAEFRDYVLNEGIARKKLDDFEYAFRGLWGDGLKKRQDSSQMMAIKASVRDSDKAYRTPSKFVQNPVPDDVLPLFTPEEMEVIFTANSNLIDTLLPEYIDALCEDGPSSTPSDLYIRRGVFIPKAKPNMPYIELNYLSSYSLALGPVEQFAQTWTKETKDKGEPVVFSISLPLVQDRIVAFAPFIEGMDMSQLEVVLAPPVTEMFFKNDGVHGGIQELGIHPHSD